MQFQVKSYLSKSVLKLLVAPLLTFSICANAQESTLAASEVESRYLNLGIQPLRTLFDSPSGFVDLYLNNRMSLGLFGGSPLPAKDSSASFQTLGAKFTTSLTNLIWADTWIASAGFLQSTFNKNDLSGESMHEVIRYAFVQGGYQWMWQNGFNIQLELGAGLPLQSRLVSVRDNRREVVDNENIKLSAFTFTGGFNLGWAF
jgi:hypothetical protein